MLIALLGTVAMNAIFWFAVQPVNSYWMEGHAVSSFAASFFRIGAMREDQRLQWTRLRDRWEYSHLARAVASSVSLLALVISLAIQS
ncbi:hypothetical protein C5748_14260 [Phyllobacterium phragmitis]|uniref:DUF1772 domain-containing protein n=1 Tax=Phyllobacterium phragmitis TaxID=2670329 RepID=A0A2S9IQX3_9HYPH|nr:hypothetical protein [Phyllobacterium phragmitis]PRD42926.1 hypothetical protein C5748_14260 [Phyllobacterium phragmitis]